MNNTVHTSAIWVIRHNGRQVARADLPPTSGIYVCERRGDRQPLYVGQSSNMRTRWRNHAQGMDAVKAGAAVVAAIPCPAAYLGLLESLLIDRFNPPLNRRRTYAPPLTQRQAQAVAADLARRLGQREPGTAHLLRGLLLEHSCYSRQQSHLRHRPGEYLAGQGRDATRRQRLCLELWGYIQQLDPEACPPTDPFRGWGCTGIRRLPEESRNS